MLLKFLIPAIVLIAFLIFTLRDEIINLVFTESFKNARDLFFIQLIGDCFKVSAWLYAYPMLSRGATKWFVASEVLFSISFVLLAYFFITNYGVVGANYAFTLNYFIYFMFTFTNIKKYSC
jgi:PST family polysaccharide transporter